MAEFLRYWMHWPLLDAYMALPGAWAICETLHFIGLCLLMGLVGLFDLRVLGMGRGAKGFAAANDGNISYRLDENRVLCTPTRVSKGFMKPEDICKVDYDGKQLAGSRRRTSRAPPTSSSSRRRTAGPGNPCSSSPRRSS